MATKRKAKFRVGQVVMIIRRLSAEYYPVKLEFLTGIGDSSRGTAWIDSLGNVKYEDEMRPLNKRERGEKKGA